MENVIELKNVGKDYTIGEVKLEVLKGINLKIKKVAVSSIILSVISFSQVIYASNFSKQ